MSKVTGVTISSDGFSCHYNICLNDSTVSLEYGGECVHIQFEDWREIKNQIDDILSQEE